MEKVRRKDKALQEEALLERAIEEEDPEAAELLFEEYHGLLHALSLKHMSSRLSYEDAYQLSAVGFMKALRRFDPAKGDSFKSYAYPYMEGELKRYYRDRAGLVSVPRRIKMLGRRVREFRFREYKKEGREPTVPEIAQNLDAGEEEIIEALTIEENMPPLSLDASVGLREGSERLSSSIGARETGYETIEERMLLKEALEVLPPRLQVILRLRMQEYSQKKVAEKLGVSQMQVSRLERQAVRKLKNIAGRKKAPR